MVQHIVLHSTALHCPLRKGWMDAATTPRITPLPPVPEYYRILKDIIVYYRI